MIKNKLGYVIISPEFSLAFFKARRNTGLSQKSLSDVIGINKSTIIKIEKVMSGKVGNVHPDVAEIAERWVNKNGK